MFYLVTSAAAKDETLPTRWENRFIVRLRKSSVEPEEQVQSITDAEDSSHVDLKNRMVRYGIQMGIRLLCFILAFFTTGIVQILCFAAAIFLPYIAVVLANVGNMAEHQPGSYAKIPSTRALPSATVPTPQALPSESSVLASSFRHQRRRSADVDTDARKAGTTYEQQSKTWVVPPRSDSTSQSGGEDHH